MSDTIAAIATGSEVSAIGIVRLSGDEAIKLADAVFRPHSGKDMSDYPDRTLVFGDLIDADGAVLDICLCTISRAPRSYTGENTAEFQCHGSPAVLRATLDALFALGARQALPGEFTKRAFLNGCMGLSQAEAVADIIDAESAQSAKNAAGQLGGAIQKKADEVYDRLTDMCSHYHAVLDYPDEDIEDFQLAEYSALFHSSINSLSRLLDTFSRGKLMRDGIPAAIVGMPNAGKSSLMNALLGYDRAIVTNIPGTTRDTIEEKIRLGALTLRLVDTAGIRETRDEIEKMGVERSRAALKSAELAIAVVDGSRPLTAEDEEILSLCGEVPKKVIVLSKKDLGQEENIPLPAGIPAVAVSSVTGEGLKSLEKVIAELFPMPAAPAGEILTNARQAEAISRALESLRAAQAALDSGLMPDAVLTEAEEAMAAIGELSGRSIRQDVTNRIFARFCVGK